MLLSKKNRLFPLFALMFVIGAFVFCGTATAYAEGAPPEQTAATAQVKEPTLNVKEVWLTGDTLHITVLDKNTATEQTLELDLRDYAKPGDEYVTVQATDSVGNTSNTIQFKNPYYQAVITTAEGENGETSTATDKPTESAVTGNPFTPDGQGGVVDNATEADGKEFFTVKTADGNVFYLIVDRERETDNVYLLNAVNEDDLASLAKPGDGKTVSAIPGQSTTTPAPEQTPAPIETPTPEPTPEKSDNNTATIAFIVVVVVIFGGIAYYFKIVRPKDFYSGRPRTPGDDTDDYGESEPFDDDTEADLDDEEDETE
jgi:hypothetical protein